VAPDARRAREEAVRLHEAACRREQSSYIDPLTGYFVMTAWHLARRGHCCGAGCRHCPYPPDEQAAAGRPPDAERWGAP
jgi:hypothetical protein